MFFAAVKPLAIQSPALKDLEKGLLPDVVDSPEVSVHIGSAVIKQAIKEGLAQDKDIPTDDGELEEWIREQIWQPKYRALRKVEKVGASRRARGEMGITGDWRS